MELIKETEAIMLISFTDFVLTTETLNVEFMKFIFAIIFSSNVSVGITVFRRVEPMKFTPAIIFRENVPILGTAFLKTEVVNETVAFIERVSVTNGTVGLRITEAINAGLATIYPRILYPDSNTFSKSVGVGRL